MSIRKIKNKSGQIRYQVSKACGSTRIRKNFKTHREALAYDRAELIEHKPLGETLNETIETYYRLNSKKKESEYNEKLWLKELYEFLNDQGVEAVSQVRPLHLLKFQSHLKESGERKNTTVNRRFSMVSHFFTFCEQVELIAENPCAKIKSLPDDGEKRYIPPAEDAHEAFQYICSNALDFLIVCASTGARPIEIRRLTWRDVDLPRGQMVLRSKKGHKASERTVPMLSSVRDILIGRYEKDAIPLPNHPVFQAKDGGLMEKRFGSQNLSRAIKRANKERERKGLAPMKPFTLYAFRHMFCSDISRAGYNQTVVGSLMGHSNAQTTSRYFHWNSEDPGEVLAKVDRKILAFKRPV